MNIKKVTRCTGAQIKQIIDYMSNNLKFVSGKDMSVAERRAHWHRLRDILKSYGPDKSVGQWQHTWRDMKNRAQKNWEAHKQAVDENISLPEHFFSEKTVKILKIINSANAEGTDSQKDGVSGDESNPAREEKAADRKDESVSKSCTEIFPQIKVYNMRSIDQKKIRCTGAQMRRLIDYMTANLQFANKTKAVSPIEQKQFTKQWTRLTKQLNACGPQKTVQQWRFTWRDLKKRARIEGAAHDRAVEGGGNPEPLSQKLEMVLKILHAAESEDTGQSGIRMGVEVKIVKEEESYDCDDEGGNDNRDEQPRSCVGDEIAITFKEEVQNYTTVTLEDTSLTVPYDNSTDPLILTESPYNSQPYTTYNVSSHEPHTTRGSQQYTTYNVSSHEPHTTHGSQQYTTYNISSHEPHTTHSSNDPPTPHASSVTSNTELISAQTRPRIQKPGRPKRNSIRNILQSINKSLIDVNKLSAEMLQTQNSIAEAERDRKRIATVQLRRQHADSKAVPYAEVYKRLRPKDCECRLCRPEDFTKSTEPIPEFPCPMCPKVFSNKRSLTRHKYYSHKSKEVLKFCAPCDKWIPHTRFNDHLKTAAKHLKDEDSVFCKKCNKRVYKRHLKSHMKQHHYRPEYCKPCDRWYTKSSYKNHLANSLRHVSKDTYKFTCELCNRKYLNKGDIERHMKVVHLNMLPHKCPHCESAFKYRWGLKKHVLNIHDKKPVPKNVICDICGSAWETLGMLRNHIVIHTGERPYKCKVCDATFRQSGALYTHNRLKHLKEKCAPKKKQNPTKKKQNTTKKKQNTTKKKENTTKRKENTTKRNTRSANKKVQNTEQE